MDETAQRYLIALKLVEKLGNVGIRSLLETFPSPEAVFSAPIEQLQTVASIGVVTARNIKGFKDWPAVDEEMAKMKSLGVVMVTFNDERFPTALKNIHDCPPFLYVHGELAPGDIYIAVVGSRQASPHGRYITEKLARELALKGITVVSGMARGIDSAAHRGALSVGGKTVAVLGSGIDVIYPPENVDLYRKISASGAVVSEFSFGTRPNAANFPLRNRIISGFSLGVVVVEASERSGSLITARLALEQGREVFAVPGAIDVPGSRGTNRLIKEGAKLVQSVSDILEEIAPQIPYFYQSVNNRPDAFTPKICIPSGLSPEEKKILINLGDGKQGTVDDIIQKTGFSAPQILNILLQLEIRGLVRRLPGNIYVIEG